MNYCVITVPWCITHSLYECFTNVKARVKKVEENTRLDDDLEMQLVDAKKELINSREAVTVAQESGLTMQWSKRRT